MFQIKIFIMYSLRPKI